MIIPIRSLLPGWQELVPWTDKRGRLHTLRATVFVLLLAPIGWLAFRWFTSDLGPEPVNAAIHSTGYWTIWLLLASLVVTPLRVFAQTPNVVVVRRMVGNGALLYGLAHILLYAMDQKWRLMTVASEILHRFYLTIGFVALLGLIVLGLTSTDGWARWLGRTWKRLHRIVYGLVVLALIHYMLQSKLDVSQSLLGCGVFTWLMLWRFLPVGMDRQTWPMVAISCVAAALTLADEYLWYRFGTRINPLKVVESELDVSFGLHPAGEVMVLGLLATGAAALRRVGTSPLGEKMRFTVLIYVLGSFGDDLMALFMGWSHDDVLPQDITEQFMDVVWVVSFALLGVARWRLRGHWQRRLIDALWLACVFYQSALVGLGNRSFGAILAALIVAGTILLGHTLWHISRSAATLLLPLGLFLAVQVYSLL